MRVRTDASHTKHVVPGSTGTVGWATSSDAGGPLLQLNAPSKAVVDSVASGTATDTASAGTIHADPLGRALRSTGDIVIMFLRFNISLPRK
ncbi:hypothetical protein C5E10_11530 [Pseudoclavibacter sp. RFBG4]|nr:hypothetical protein C5E10_11530 [Pseudoclavibacter sp. RFBG4]